MNKKHTHETLDFASFSDELELELNEVLKERMPGTVIERNIIRKLQEEPYFSFSVMPQEKPVAIQINVTELYEKALEEAGAAGSKRNIRKLAEETADIIINRVRTIPDEVFQLNDDYESMRKYLILQVVREEGNEELLEKVPHRSIEDLAVVYRFLVGSESALINYELLESFGITEEQLYADAMENAPKINPIQIRNLRDMIAELSGSPDFGELPEEEKVLDLYFVGNKKNCLGASAYFYPGVMEQCAQLLGGSYYMLPSSIHEVLLLKDDGQIDEKKLGSMITDINASVVIPSERLTDHPYYYNAAEKSFRSA